jgi:predicted RNase H-like nuclease
MQETVVGVDGCRDGWIAVIWTDVGAHCQLLSSFREVLSVHPGIVAVDMPIGLPPKHGRRAESEARKVLGARSPSVFSTVSRAAYVANTWDEACKINLMNSDPRRKLSKQSFAIFKKVREVDAAMTPALQSRIKEVHPEVIFYEMNDRQPLRFSKKKRDGAKERTKLLEISGFPWSTLGHPIYLKKNVADDDIIDACACAWSARRILEGTARHYPETEERDVRGLLMRIHA